MIDRQKIYVIDDDPAITFGLRLLLTAADFEVETYASGEAFLADPAPKRGCLIIDVTTRDINWLQFRIALAKQKQDLVVLVISTQGDMPTVIGAMETGAIDFIEKPFDAKQIIASVRRALDIRAKIHDQAGESDAAKRKIALLTARELSVAEELLRGKSNKAAAHALGISPRTIEVHRAHMMRKLGVENISDLVRLWYAAGAISSLFSQEEAKQDAS